MVDALLQVTLVPGWVDLTYKNPNGGPTYARSLVGLANPLQVSYALYKGGMVPNPSIRDLIKLSEGFSNVLDKPRLVSTNGGPCNFGLFGEAIFEASNFIQAFSWCLSNGKDLIRATYICTIKPKESEILEVEKIVQTLTLVENKAA